MLDKETKKTILTAQKNEITEHLIYEKLAEAIEGGNNKKVIRDISQDELKHYNFWKEYTKKEIKPNKLKFWFFYLISRIFGITFGIKLMEKGEQEAQATYEKVSHRIPEAKEIVEDEDEHEQELLELIDEEKLKYVSSIVLGLNDALVELTGALAGFTFALQNTNLIAITGLITGIAASFSMGASEYLSTKSGESEKNPVKASLYTGFAYVITVFFLIFPYLILTNPFLSLAFTLFNALLIIFLFTFYISVAKALSFRKRFGEMAFISLGIAALSFAIGFLIRTFLGVEA